MSYLVLARKYRPRTFDEVVKQEHITKTLANSIKAGRLAHAILFAGTRGTGKTTIARILAKAMNCEQGPTPEPCGICKSCNEITKGYSPDVIEIDGASNNGVDNIRDLRDNAKYMPSYSRFKIYIIDEVHMLSQSAFNALLKTLEEPPSHVIFFFATTEPRKIPVTILSRCQRHDLRRIDTPSIIEHMRFISKEEGMEIEEETLDLIAREGAGSMRDSLSLLDHVISCSDGKVSHETALDMLAAVDRKIVFSFSRAIIDGDIKKGLTIIDEVYARGCDIKNFYKDVLDHFRDLILICMEQPELVDASASEIDIVSKHIEGETFISLHRILEFLLKEESAIHFSNDPKLLFEMILIRLNYIKPILAVDTLIEKIDLLYNSQPTEAGDGSYYGYDDKNIGKIEENRLKEEPAVYNESENDTEIEKITDNKEELWKKTLISIGNSSPATASYLESSIPIELSEDTIKISTTANKLVIERLNSKKSLDIIEKAVSNIAGKELKVIIDGKISNDRSVKSNKRDLQKYALNNEIIKDALDIFDGRLKEVKILREE